MREMFEDEFKKCEKALFLVAVMYLHNTHDAEDVLQDAALSAYRAIDGLKNKEYFKTWMTRIVINKCKNFMKSRHFTEELNDNTNAFYNIQTDEIEIMDAICKLKPEMSVYITLRFYNGMTYDEMAKSMMLPVSTVKHRTKKALSELKTIMEGDKVNEE